MQKDHWLVWLQEENWQSNSKLYFQGQIYRLESQIKIYSKFVRLKSFNLKKKKKKKKKIIKRNTDSTNPQKEKEKKKPQKKQRWKVHVL